MNFAEERQLRDAINSRLSLADLIEQHFRVRLVPNTSCLCPFHEDSRRSAKFFTNSLVCFAETKTYRPWDVLQWFGLSADQIRQKFQAQLNLPARSDLSEDSKLRWDLFFSVRELAQFQEFSVLTSLKLWREFVEQCYKEKES